MLKCNYKPSLGMDTLTCRSVYQYKASQTSLFLVEFSLVDHPIPNTLSWYKLFAFIHNRLPFSFTTFVYFIFGTCTRHAFTMQPGTFLASALAAALVPAGALAATPPGSPSARLAGTSNARLAGISNTNPPGGAPRPRQQCFLSADLGPDVMGQPTLLEATPFVNDMFDFHGYRCQMGKDCSHVRCRGFPAAFKMTARNYPDGKGPLGTSAGDSFVPGPVVKVYPAPR